MVRVFAAFLALVAGFAPVSCAPPGQGKAPLIANIDRPLSQDFVQISVVERKLVEVNASGRTVRAVAPDGFCFPTAGIMTSEASAFVLAEPCGGKAAKGVVSMSIAKNGLFGDEPPSEENFAAFRAYLETQEGSRQLGLDAGSGAVFLIGTEYEDGVLYALTRDASGSGLEFSGQIICRAFTELNGRMVVISAISGKGDDRSPAAMREDMKTFMNNLQQANREFGV